MAEFLNKNIKYLRIDKGISQQELADKVGIDRSTISRIENNEIETTVPTAERIAKSLSISFADLVSKDLTYDNATNIDIVNTIQIPVLGTIKAGIPLEAQENILEYIEIPIDWTKGDKKFFGLQVSGNSMFPRYEDKDIVVFEQNSDKDLANNKDCAVMVNGDDATFKKVMISDKGVALVPYNAEYEPLFYTIEEVEKKPVRIIGIARERRVRL